MSINLLVSSRAPYSFRQVWLGGICNFFLLSFKLLPPRGQVRATSNYFHTRGRTLGKRLNSQHESYEGGSRIHSDGVDFRTGLKFAVFGKGGFPKFLVVDFRGWMATTLYRLEISNLGTGRRRRPKTGRLQTSMRWGRVQGQVPREIR